MHKVFMFALELDPSLRVNGLMGMQLQSNFFFLILHLSAFSFRELLRVLSRLETPAAAKMLFYNKIIFY